MNGNRLWDNPDQNAIAYLGWDGAMPVPGDWNGDGKTEMAAYCKGAWFRDMDGSDTWNPSDPTELSYWGWDASLTPVAGDWNGDGKDELGVYSKGVWFRDADNSHSWNAANQQALAYFGWSGALPVVGNWAGSGSPLMAAEGAVVASSNTPTLTQAELQPIVTEALARWTAAGVKRAGSWTR